MQHLVLDRREEDVQLLPLRADRARAEVGVTCDRPRGEKKISRPSVFGDVWSRFARVGCRRSYSLNREDLQSKCNSYAFLSNIHETSHEGQLWVVKIKTVLAFL